MNFLDNIFIKLIIYINGLHNILDKCCKNKPFLRIMRIHLPIPYLLIFTPILWVICSSIKETHHSLKYLSIFLLLSLFARSIGCIINDILDKNIDKNCSRTKDRPLASEQISIKNALILLFFLLILLISIAKIFLSDKALFISLMFGPLIFIYPITKRFCNYPQIFLGFIFNLGVWPAWITIRNDFNFIPFLLYIASVCWTIGYDIIYAHQDYDDDLKLGYGSIVTATGESVEHIIIFFYRICFLCLVTAGIHQNAGFIFYIFIFLSGYILYWQVENFDFNNQKNSGALFRINAIFAILSSLGFIFS
ncbi:4-hydroxybenzoate octaprenyltransferase [Lyticum sinuosum]|uniref:4-hydroxybenzoate polyprenyltransferase n=1 Tax=Lyticum sinuosum TaxID=1332059 RepID=A0AAE5AHC9_9RICK|nr:4-hydroxybenzoate octaprenyltransferase [Lyticum sinuosum]MDZ5760968.1 4-hydroxybenzoate octaprenyltransferase [Lyticum sinuosum]